MLGGTPGSHWGHTEDMVSSYQPNYSADVGFLFSFVLKLKIQKREMLCLRMAASLLATAVLGCKLPTFQNSLLKHRSNKIKKSYNENIWEQNSYVIQKST